MGRNAILLKEIQQIGLASALVRVRTVLSRVVRIGLPNMLLTQEGIGKDKVVVVPVVPRKLCLAPTLTWSRLVLEKRTNRTGKFFRDQTRTRPHLAQ